MIELNDIHARLNPTPVRELVRPSTMEQVADALDRAAAHGLPVAICGGRHAMGGQQFACGAMQLDMTGLDRVVRFEPARALVTVGAGIQWPGLHAALRNTSLTFRQKQTGADRLTIGGALSANIHGRGIDLAPFVADVESFTLLDAAGRVRHCDRARRRGAVLARRRRLRPLRPGLRGHAAPGVPAQGAPHRRDHHAGGHRRVVRGAPGRRPRVRGLPVRDRPRGPGLPQSLLKNRGAVLT
jgi:hypothetical protein